MTFGLTDQGLFPPRLPDLRAEINQALLSLFGPSIDVSDESIEGQASGINAERFALLWELLEILYGAIDPNAASGALLDALSALTGTYRQPPTYSTVTVILTGSPATVVPGDSIVSTGVEAGRFVTIGDAEIVAATAWAQVVWPAGSIVTAGGNVYYALAEVPDTVDEPTHTGRDGIPLPGSPAEKWLWLGGGAGYVEQLCRAAVAGPVFAPAAGYTVVGEIEVIETPIGGWDGVVNLEDVDQGADQQPDEGLRISRALELAGQGTSPVDALRARLLRLEDVDAVTIFFNNSDAPDADGLPPHSVEAMIQGGDDDAIRELLWATVAAGILTHGTESGTVVDSQGRDQTIRFSRPEEIPIYIEMEVEVDADLFPADGADQIKAAIAASGNAQASGMDARSFAIAAPALDIDGVMTVLEVLIGTSPGPTLPDTIPISLRQRATFDVANITVVVTPGVP